jgi:hypothetical protein
LQNPISKTPLTKKGWQVSPEFKPQNQQKKKKKKNPNNGNIYYIKKYSNTPKWIKLKSIGFSSTSLEISLLAELSVLGSFPT